MYLITLISTIIIDSIWLLLSRSIIYEKTFDNMGATLSQLFIMYALYVYVLLSIGIEYLRTNNADWKIIFLYGFIVYGVYDGTMLATFDNYNIVTGIIDNIWGGVLCVLVNYLSNYIDTLLELFPINVSST
jgi:uncharacterized membrane protein